MQLMGWTGHFLNVDLGTGRSEELYVPVSYYTTLLGGVNLGARLLWNFEAYRHAPLDPESWLLFLNGPLSGTNFPGSGRVHIMGRSPQTNICGESSLGGYLGQAIKAAGYDGILIHGKAEKPVYLEVDGLECTCRLLDAADLWGLDAFQTEDALRRRKRGVKVEIAVIGPAGEHLVPMASIVHRKHNFAARTGLGALMGSKNLKALLVCGEKPVKIADPQKFGELLKVTRETLNKEYWSQRRRKWGTVGNLEWAVETGRTPIKNWQQVDWKEQSKAITGETLANTYLTGRATCYGCPLACKRRIKVDEAPYTVAEGAGPEYETAAGLGSMLLNSNLPAFLKASDLCNRLGLDTISVGSTIAWAIESYEHGLLGKEWTQGEHLAWGDSDLIIRLVEQIGSRTGLGALLCEGSRAASQKVGQGSEAFAIQVKGLELGYHHPIAARGMEYTFATNPRGATHMESPDVLNFLEATDAEWVKQIAESVDRSSLPNAYVLCSFMCNPMGHPFIADVLSSITGVTWDMDQLQMAAARGWYLRRMFNRKCGVGREADQLPGRIKRQLKEAACDHNDVDRILNLYLDYRGLDESGMPSEARLKELGMQDLIPPGKRRKN
jgi:aldehyde:ferredoxin oxidoreductase